MKPKMPTEQSSQEEPKETAVKPDASTARTLRVCFQKFLSYFAGDMAPLGKWMESR